MARVYTFTVTQPCTVKIFLRRRCGLSSRMVIRLKQEAAGITVNGEHARVIDPLAVGDKVVLKMPEESDDSPGIHAPISVVWEDEDFLVIDKPGRKNGFSSTVPVGQRHLRPGGSREKQLCGRGGVS